jgi:hypothetical protein
VFEYTRGSQSITEFAERRKLILGLVKRVIPVGNFLESSKLDAFSTVMSLTVGKANSQYTDFLLAVALYQYRGLPGGAFVLSTDARAFPLGLFDVMGVLTINNERGEIANLYLFSLNMQHYAHKAVKVAA